MAMLTTIMQLDKYSLPIDRSYTGKKDLVQKPLLFLSTRHSAS
uniref:Uncharacterized protein n=1 Tax=Anguilla anguilla TaxID=7936 RepID=A0A0E9RMA6_ANGAN